MQNFKFTKCLRDLFNLNRSLTGKGTLLTIKYFSKLNPELKILKFKSGKKIFDWKIPQEWIIKDAYIKHIKSNKKFAEFKKNNLHLVGYSMPQKKIIDLKNLKKNIHVLDKIPNAIPYVTSYYKKNWGFCMSKNSVIQTMTLFCSWKCSKCGQLIGKQLTHAFWSDTLNPFLSKAKAGALAFSLTK